MNTRAKKCKSRIDKERIDLYTKITIAQIRSQS